jgi:pyruvate/2-oxoglutarate dehydrogenase complex dihydrolipoamide acyltransferase (E2) component
VIPITLPDEVWKDVDPGTEALVDKWLVGEGDAVRHGQVIADVVIVKTNQEITAPADGRIDKILIKAEETFARNQPVGLLKETT